MPTGTNSLVNVLLPSAWDAAELARLQLRDGRTYDQIIANIDSALTVLNGSLNSGYLGGLVSLTTDPTVEYRTGAANGYEDHTENAQPENKRAEVTGHMLPIKKKDRGLGWTADFLEECRTSQINADIQSLAEDTLDVYEKALLTRMFKIEDESGVSYGLGSTGISAPYANGGASSVVFTPPANPTRAAAFASSHNHMTNLNGITQANLETAVGNLWEHGVDGPYELLISQANVADWQNTTNVTGFVKKGLAEIQYGNATDLANIGDMYIGGVQTKYGFCRMVANARIPATYYSVFKTYGENDQRNTLRVRYDEMFGWGAKLVTENLTRYPLLGAISVVKFGVGVANRVSAVCIRSSASAYATPTIS